MVVEFRGLIFLFCGVMFEVFGMIVMCKVFIVFLGEFDSFLGYL